MDIGRLEKLSCLKIADENKEDIKGSLLGVFNMMKALEVLEMPIIAKLIPTPTELAEDIKGAEVMVSKENGIDGLHVDSGYFLAPKALKK